jgi:hypothetical protein
MIRQTGKRCLPSTSLLLNYSLSILSLEAVSQELSNRRSSEYSDVPWTPKQIKTLVFSIQQFKFIQEKESEKADELYLHKNIYFNNMLYIYDSLLGYWLVLILIESEDRCHVRF